MIHFGKCSQDQYGTQSYPFHLFVRNNISRNTKGSQLLPPDSNEDGSRPTKGSDLELILTQVFQLIGSITFA